MIFFSTDLKPEQLLTKTKTMKPKNLRLQLHAYSLLSVFLILLSAFIINGCKKSDAPLATTEESNVGAAKEWWYGTFRKSAAYSEIDRTSPFAPPEGNSTKKYPDWERAISYSVGRLEIVELPLVYVTNSVLLPGMQKLNNTPEGARIAGSAIHRLMLIKKADGTMVVRIVTLVPSPEYAKQYNYDISHISLKGLPSDFSGYQMIGGWDESQKNIIKITNGKPEKKIEIIIAKELAKRKASNNFTAREVCDMVWVPHMVWVCVVVSSGDAVADQERCHEQGYWVEQGGDYELQCHDEPDEDPCLGMSSEECMCQLYGIGCGGGGDDEDDCGVPSNINEILSNGTSTSELIERSNDPEVIEPNGDITRTWKGRWQFYTGRWLTYVWHYRSFDQGVHRKEGGVWKWLSISHTSHSQTGTSPFSTTCTMTGNTATIDADKLSATMELEYEVKVCVECLGIPFGRPAENKTSSILFPVHW